MDVKKLLGQKIRKLRKEKQFSQEHFSELLDLNPRQIVRIENGESFPTAENLTRIADVLGVRVEELFFNEFLYDEDYLRKRILEKMDSYDIEKLRTLYLVAVNL